MATLKIENTFDDMKSSISDKISDTESKIDKVENSLSKTEDKIDGLDDQIDEMDNNINNRLDAQAQIMVNIRNDLQASINMKDKEINKVNKKNKELLAIIRKQGRIIANLKYFVTLILSKISNFTSFNTYLDINLSMNFFEKYPQMSNDDFWENPDEMIFDVVNTIDDINDRTATEIERHRDENANLKKERNLYMALSYIFGFLTITLLVILVV